MCLGAKMTWGQSVSCCYGAKMFGPKGVRPKLAGPNCEAAAYGTTYTGLWYYRVGKVGLSIWYLDV